MTSIEKIEATLAVQALVGRYAHLADAGRMADCAALFAPDATVLVIGKERTGRAAIQAWLEAMAASSGARVGKHIVSTVVVDAVQDGRASARSDMLYVSAAPGTSWQVLAIGAYHDRFVEQADGWRFAWREIVFTSQPQAAP